MLCGRFCPPRLAWPARCPSSRQPAVAQAHRLPALIAGNAVVIKQGSDYYEHFYKALRPWHHYIPVARDLSDLDQKLAWAKANDAQARAIGGNARSLAREHLRMEDVYCYHIMAFTRFAALQKFRPVVTDAMSHVFDDEEIPAGDCDCPATPAGPGEGEGPRLHRSASTGAQTKEP